MTWDKRQESVYDTHFKIQQIIQDMTHKSRYDICIQQIVKHGFVMWSVEKQNMKGNVNGWVRM